MKNSYIFMWEAVECSGLFISFTSISLRADCVPGPEQGDENQMVTKIHQVLVFKLRLQGNRSGPRDQGSCLDYNTTEGFRCCGARILQLPATEQFPPWIQAVIITCSERKTLFEAACCSWSPPWSALTWHENFDEDCHSQDSYGLGACERNC